ncbi:DUF7940 domain-containing protein [Erwinia psidii]|uniref:Uncharacterized protein n=1 Tax=Erwinia psidii TaxID=69224 RepID=A0A3N6SG28_9GAMM|nr:hypothetical protein [Erwinia psidii]MCX8955817.1 hypothetical protein [Erwinia psidii]MCX8961626.1 hypothetical protein [Erwinia psidii]MCX8965726.1 hypothetical protein [Erwinia psidii]RQM37651.1 hypothetical protein EB241_14075 [Erwinia psidii]
MKFIFYLGAILLAIIVLMLVRRYSALEFVRHANLLFKTWSVWLASLGSALGAWVGSFPDSAMRAWQLLPADVKAIIPQHYLGMIGAFMVAMAVIAQFIRQPALAEQRQQLEQPANLSRQ